MTSPVATSLANSSLALPEYLLPRMLIRLPWARTDSSRGNHAAPWKMIPSASFTRYSRASAAILLERPGKRTRSAATGITHSSHREYWCPAATSFGPRAVTPGCTEVDGGNCVLATVSSSQPPPWSRYHDLRLCGPADAGGAGHRGYGLCGSSRRRRRHCRCCVNRPLGGANSSWIKHAPLNAMNTGAERPSVSMPGYSRHARRDALATLAPEPRCICLRGRRRRSLSGSQAAARVMRYPAMRA